MGPRCEGLISLNKTILIAGGASLASLAAGAASGYFFARNKLGKQFDERLDAEVAAVKKQYSIMLMQAKEDKSDPAELADKNEHERGEYEPSDEEILAMEEQEQSSRVIDALREAKKAGIKASGERALTDYQGISTSKMAADGTIKSNIFENAPKTPHPLPPRDMTTGKFVKKNPELTPYLIKEEEFLENEPEHAQENYMWFVKDQTLIRMEDQEAVDIDIVGEALLTLFPPKVGDDPQCIYVRNEGLKLDLDITLTEESLTEYMGLGETDDELLD